MVKLSTPYSDLTVPVALGLWSVH